MDQRAKFLAAVVPAHIDPALVVDFDYFADRRYAEAGHPHLGLLKLCDEVGHGIFWTPHNGGHWFITDHEMLFEAARDPAIFSSGNASFPPLPPKDEPYYPPLSSDPPEHIKYRMPLMRAFSPQRIQALGAEIRQFANELIDTVEGQGGCDFLEAVAEPLPIFMFMRLMGYDTARYKEFRQWAVWMTQPDEANKLKAYANTVAMTRECLDSRRGMRRDDLLSHLLDEEIDGRPFSQKELDGICILLFGAGLDTVVNSLSFGMEHLARTPELQDRLRAEPSLIAEAVEEMLRRCSVGMAARSVAQDTNFRGATLKAGERVTLLLPVGNLDPKVFPDPARFDLDRENKLHVTFNSGPHRCVGSHLARLEMVTLFEEWLRRMPNVRLDPANPPRYRIAIVNAIEALPLLWGS
jgi:cytochrome P450